MRRRRKEKEVEEKEEDFIQLELQLRHYIHMNIVNEGRGLASCAPLQWRSFIHQFSTSCVEFHTYHDEAPGAKFGKSKETKITFSQVHKSLSCHT